jgi:hypothetical protein
MSEPHVRQVPPLGEARSWRGQAVDDIAGSEVGTVAGFFVDAFGGAASWLVLKCRRGRFSSSFVVVPAADCAGGGGRVWVAHERDAIRRAPLVDSRRPLLREHELTICAHYGIGERVGRAAAVGDRDEGAITSVPG